MRTIVAGHMAFSGSEFAELAMGIDPELFTGPTDETPMERAARLDAARDVLTDLWREDPELAAYAESLMNESAEVIELPARRTAVGRWAA
ncbi:hypothetical protein [Streptodolium elevatio]|uniref:Uncharacterized protein n=1 Tax=Streptodolium elevatio TaxID=3157996 RepID=A0ABV3DDD9_9ACTN